MTKDSVSLIVESYLVFCYCEKYTDYNCTHARYGHMYPFVRGRCLVSEYRSLGLFNIRTSLLGRVIDDCYQWLGW